MPRIRRPGFIPLPRNENTDYKIEIKGVDQTDSVVNGEFTIGLIGEDSSFSMKLDNNNEKFNDLYSGDEDVAFYLDFGTATNKRFLGKIEKISRDFGEYGNVLTLKGTNKYHSKLLDITVTEEFNSVECSAILKSLVGDYLTGYTTNNVDTSTVNMTVKWEDVPFFDVVIDIANRCGFDCYVDTDGDLHFFEKNSQINNTNYVFQAKSGNLIKVEGLREDLIDIRNSIKVTSEDDEGLPIVYTSEDSTSIASYGTKEEVIKNTNIGNTTQAKEVADSARTDTAETRGKVISFFLPEINPGDYNYILHPAQNISRRFRFVKITHKIPDQITTSVIDKTKDLQVFLKRRKQTEAGLEKLSNPYRMKWSYNFTFDDLTDIDSDASTNITVDNGALKVLSGTEGIMVSDKKNFNSSISEAQLQIVGEGLDDVTVKLSTDDSATYPDTITKDERITLSDTTESSITIKVTVSSSTARVRSLAILVK